MIKISNNLGISFETNEIIKMTKNDSNTRTKVEPRIMHVLQILINNSPKVVSREHLISEVWNDYGGADDALNQTISHLRKLLNDTNKDNRIIETVVKKGYRFTGATKLVIEDRKDTLHKKKKSRLWLIIIAIALLIFVFIIYLISSTNSNAPVAPLNDKTNVTNPASGTDQN